MWLNGWSDSSPKVMIVNSHFDILRGKSLSEVSLTTSSQDWNSAKFLVQTKIKKSDATSEKIKADVISYIKVHVF